MIAAHYTVAHYIMALAILVPIAGAVFICLLDRKPNYREAVSIATAVITFFLVVSLYPAVSEGRVPRLIILEPFTDVTLSLALEPLGMLFALMASFLWIVTSIYSIGYMRGHHEKNQTRFYAFFAIAMSSAMGVAMAANGFTLFLFYEILTLTTFPLVTHHGDEKAKRAGRIYLFMLLGTSISMLLLAVIWTWTITGTVDFTVNGVFESVLDENKLSILLLLYVFGIGKAALMPFHRWLPSAMVAPTPVSALLHAVAVVKAGVFAILKIVIYLFGVELVAQLPVHAFIAYIAAFTIVATGIIALRKDNLKARLAYSTIGQLSYIVLGAATPNIWGIIGGSTHMLMHGFSKITLFFCAGAIMVATHKTEVSQLQGIGRRMPITMAAFIIATIGIIGAPPTGTMWSKWFLLQGVSHAHDWITLTAMVAGTLLSIGYLLPIAIRAYFPSKPVEPVSEITEAPLPILIALLITAAGCIVLFFAPNFAFFLIESIVGIPRL